MSFETPTEGHLHWNEDEYKVGRHSVLRTILILSVVTVVEVAGAMSYDFMYPNGGPRYILDIFVAIMSVVKVYYIMGIFMHMKHETTWFQRTVLLPFIFLLWAVIAFSVEGSSWHAMRELLNFF